MAVLLIKIAVDENAPYAVRLAAIRDVLDRAGLGAKHAMEVGVELQPWEELLRDVTFDGVARITRAEHEALKARAQYGVLPDESHAFAAPKAIEPPLVPPQEPHAYRPRATVEAAECPGRADAAGDGYADALAPTTEHTVKRHKRLADLRIDNTFGDYPINAITRDDISQWVARMKAAGKRPSTIRNAYFLVRQVLAHAVADGRLDANPADYVKLPTDHNTGHVRAVDDPAIFLSAAQVRSLAEATAWPYNVMVHLAAWSGLRAAELAGLRVGDLTLPKPSINPNALAKPGTLRVERTIAWVGGKLMPVPPKGKAAAARCH